MESGIRHEVPNVRDQGTGSRTDTETPVGAELLEELILRCEAANRSAAQTQAHTATLLRRIRTLRIYSDRLGTPLLSEPLYQ